MPSTFAWLDYSEQERRRALDVISLFKLQDTRDELGLASIRDAFAERFFPGTTTIQNRNASSQVTMICSRLCSRGHMVLSARVASVSSCYFAAGGSLFPKWP